MAQGYGYIVAYATSWAGDWNDTGSGIGLNPGPGETHNGTADFQIGGDDQFYLFDDADVYLGTYTAATLPAGFEFTQEVPPYGAGVKCFLTCEEFNEAIGGVGPDLNTTANNTLKDLFFQNPGYSGVTGFVDNLCNTWSSDFSWNAGSNGTLDATVTAKYLSGFEVSGSFTSSEPGSLSFYQLAGVSGLTTPIPSGPNGVFIFGWSTEESDPPTGPVTNPVLNTTTPTITVTPPTNGSIIVVTTPTTTITTNSTPLVPITITLPPGTPVVSIIPGPTGGNPPPLIIPIDLDVEADGMVIDLALAPTMQLIGNPSGIYTIVPNQRFDILYERALGTTTSQTVAIPRPFGVTSYIPEND